MRRRTRTLGAFLTAMLLTLAAPGPAGALTLADLDSGGSFFSLDGTLEFTGFSITPSGSIASPLDQFEVIVLDMGFRVVGAFSAFDGETGSMDIDYTVNGSAALTDAFLSFNGAASGVGSEAAIQETLGALGVAMVHAREGDLSLFDAVALGGTTTTLGVLTDVTLTSVPQGSAVISELSQTFEVVPEPGAFALLLFGLGGALLLRRTR